MSDQTRSEAIRGEHREPASTEATSLDLEPEVEQTWLRPRGRDRYPRASWPSEVPQDPADATDTATSVEQAVEARPAASAVSRVQTPATERRRGRRASESIDPEAEAAERRAADRATVAAQGEAIRRATAHRRASDAVRLREADAVKPRPSVEGAIEQVVPSVSPVESQTGPEADLQVSSQPEAPTRRLIAGGVFERSPGGRRRDPAAAPNDQVDVATRAIAVVRQAGPGPEGVEPATPFVPARTLVMGILNVTLDSFSDGGRYARYDDAIAHARALASDGADIIDVGGESTRPGAPRVGVHEEQRRVIPVIRQLVDLGLRVSVDTMNAATAFAAVEAGADIINDVSGGLADHNMAQVVKDTDATYIAMHWRGHSDVMGQRATYADAVAEVKAELFQRVAELIVEGVHPDRIVIDPGLGFAKLAEHNWQVLGHFDELAELGLPILVAASRKRFLGGLLPEEAGVRERDPATAVISALSAQAGAWGVRVHDVASTRAALDVWEAWQKGSRG